MSSNKSIEERIGRIQGVLEAIPGQISDLFDRIGNVRIELTELKARQDGNESSLKETKRIVKDAPSFDPEKCEKCVKMIESYGTKIQTLYLDYQERKEKEKEAKNDTKGVIIYIVDKIVTIVVTLLIAYLLYRLGLGQGA